MYVVSPLSPDSVMEFSARFMLATLQSLTLSVAVVVVKDDEKAACDSYKKSLPA